MMSNPLEKKKLQIALMLQVTKAIKAPKENKAQKVTVAWMDPKGPQDRWDLKESRESQVSKSCNST